MNCGLHKKIPLRNPVKLSGPVIKDQRASEERGQGVVDVRELLIRISTLY